jgi:hypothetical protein
MRINGQKVKGLKVAFDGCHKIYVCETPEDVKETKRLGYKLCPMEDIKYVFDISCPLRFISNWELDKDYVRQFEQMENAVFEEEK